MLSPDHTVRFIWDFLSLVIIGIETFAVPLNLAFAGADVPLYWVLFVVGFFTVDIFLNFFTGFQYRGITVTSMQISAVRYLTSVWIWIDVISTVPWDMIFTSEDSSIARLMRILRIGKLLRLAKLAKVRDIVTRIESKLQAMGNHSLLVSFKMWKFLIALLVFAHMLACCWGALGDMDLDDQNELHPPWMQTVSGHGGVLMAELSWARRYAFSFAWSSAVLLQGAYVPPFNPGTLLEAVFLVVANVFAFYVCALFVGSMVAMLDAMYTTKQKLKTDKSLLEGFMIKRKIPSLLQARALDDLAHSFEAEAVPDESYEKVLDKLAPAIRQNIREELYVTVMRRHPFFAQMPVEPLRFLCDQVRVIHTQRGEYVVRRGQVASSMFFVVEGQFLAQRPADDPKQEDVHLAHQAFFGAQCIFKESLRTRNVIALTNGELLEISTSEIYAVGDKYPEVDQAFRLRLQEAADSADLCMHCGFAHKISECPELKHECMEKQDRRHKNAQRSKINTRKMSFKAAVKTVVAGNRSKDRSLTSPGIRAALSAAERLGKRSDTSKGGEVLSGRGGQTSATKVELKSLSITPTAQAASPRCCIPSPDRRGDTLLPPQVATTSALSTPRLTDDEEEPLSPYSPLIKIKVPAE
jgi:CRP-like cAMP-binding protein